MVHGPATVFRLYLLIWYSLVRDPLTAWCLPDFDFVFVDWPEWKLVKTGVNVELTCMTNLVPDSIQWYYNHHILAPYQNIQYAIQKLGKNGSSLCISVSEDKDDYIKQEGLYQCVATVGSVSILSLPGRIQVAFTDPFLIPLVNHRRLLMPQDSIIIIPCKKPESLPEVDILFYKDEVPLKTPLFNKYFTTDVGDLVILQADESIQGRYSCSAYNSLLKKSVHNNSSTEVRINSKEEVSESFSLPFNFIYKNQSQVMRGDTITLLCVQHGHIHPTYEWHHKGISASIMKPISEKSGPLLEIQPKENCIYSCHVNSRTASTYSNISVIVQEPPFIKRMPKSVGLEEGQNLRLDCFFGGNPPPTVTWVFNGKFLGGRNFLVFDNDLSLKNISRNQSGIYQCFAFNPSGAAQGTSLVQVIPKTISYPKYNDLISQIKNPHRKRIKHKKDRKKKRKHIKAKDIPSKPSISKLTDESVLVAWNLKNEHMPTHKILFYKVQFKTVSNHADRKANWRTVSETILPPATTCEVTGLVINHYYKFRVAAVYSNNDHNFGPSSKKFFLEKFERLQRPSNSPQILAVETHSNNSIKVTWSYESHIFTEGFIVKYRRTGIPEDYTKVVLLGNRRRMLIVRHLKDGTPYDFKLGSFNMAGTSDYSGRKTFFPSNFRGYPSNPINSSTAILEEFTDRKIASNTHLTFVISICLLTLLVIVIVAYFIIHSFKKWRKNVEETRAPTEDSDKEMHISFDQESRHSSSKDASQNFSTDIAETMKLESR